MSSIFFNKDDTNTIKGIAVVMMLTHHFFTFPEWWTDATIFSLNIDNLIYLQSALKICVAIFCFLNGYLLWFTSEKKNLLSKIMKMMIPYWIVFSICSIIHIVCGGRVYLRRIYNRIFGIN